MTTSDVGDVGDVGDSVRDVRDVDDPRYPLFEFLEAKTPGGKKYEKFIIILILINVIAFILASLFVEEYNDAEWAIRDSSSSGSGICSDLCDTIWFGNYDDNGLAFLGIGSTSYLEIFTVIVFTIEYVLRLHVADIENPTLYRGWYGRIRYYVPSFFSMVDLVSIIPFYIDAFLLPNDDLITSQFIRMFRLLRMMRAEGRYDTALTMIDDVYHHCKSIMGTALFIGITTWCAISSLYYLAERLNPNMIYCGNAKHCNNSDNGDDIDTSLCTFDNWGFVDCTNAGCPPTDDMEYPCYNLYQSIPSASYYTLLNLFGEFPLIDQHSIAGKWVGTLVAVVAVFVFGLPTSIVGSGFETVIEQSRKENKKKKQKLAKENDEEEEENGGNDNRIQEDEIVTRDFCGNTETIRGRLYNILHTTTNQPGALALDYFINILVLIMVLDYIFSTNDVIMDFSSSSTTTSAQGVSEIINLIVVIIFTIEYCLRLYSIKEDPIYNNNNNNGRWKYFISFFSIIDLLSFLPYWIYIFMTPSIETPDSIGSNIVKMLRLLRIMRFEKYTHAFRSFDDVIRRNIDILTVTGFSALLCWIFFSAFLYLTERNSNDEEIRNNYNTIPNAMWITLLNLTGESPLCQYSIMGKIITGIIGLFATGLFGIPIGVLGAGFQEVVEEENDDDIIEEQHIIYNIQKEKQKHDTKMKDRGLIQDIVNIQTINIVQESIMMEQGGQQQQQQQQQHAEEDNNNDVLASLEAQQQQLFHNLSGTTFEQLCYKFVNGYGSRIAIVFEIIIYCFILLTVIVGIYQTIDGEENTFHEIEWFAVIIFTIEYIIRFIGIGADPEFVVVTTNNNTNTSTTAAVDDNTKNNNNIKTGEEQPLLSDKKDDKTNSGAIIITNIAKEEETSSPTSSSILSKNNNAILCRLRFIISFYSIIDLLAIIPFYVAHILPKSIVNEYDEYLRMIRIIRLIKLDKYIPSITLIDDVIRLKWKVLAVAFFAAWTLWILFAAIIYVFEHVNISNEIDPVPLYGCDDECTMADRFQQYLDSLYYVGVHLTGDYPIIEYSWPSRIINFFMVIGAIGVVSIPSAIIADGFANLMVRKNRIKCGDDWYDIKYKELDGVDPPKSKLGGPIVDQMQSYINTFLNGEETDEIENITTGEKKHIFKDPLSRATRVFIFIIIIANVIAVLLESIPSIDKSVGNQKGNFFDTFEAFSVTVFAIEYILRLFSAPKNRKALYSSRIYAMTFFGIVDLLSTAPWFIQQFCIYMGYIESDDNSDTARIFRIFRIFRILQLEDFFTAFSLLDNVFRSAYDTMKATGLLALVIWVGCGALFYIFEHNNPNWRNCDNSIPTYSMEYVHPITILQNDTETTTEIHYYMGCYDFTSTKECNDYYGPNMCEQKAFTNMPTSLYYTAVFLGGEWGVVDFTWPGRIVCLFLCIVGIGLYAIPLSVLFSCFAVVLGIEEEEDDDDNDE